MRNTCAQSGVCSECGARIFRFTPTQQWMAADGTTGHKRAPIDSDSPPRVIVSE